jgi:hypothetical protein
MGLGLPYLVVAVYVLQGLNVRRKIKNAEKV